MIDVNWRPLAGGTPCVRKVCKECGSEEVIIDANAIWDHENQMWSLNDTYDEEKGFCRDCDGDCRIVDKELNA